MTTRHAFAGLLLALCSACTPDAPALQSSTAAHTDFTCTAPGATPANPRAYFAPFDEVEQEALCVLDSANSEVLVAHYNIRRQSYLDKLVELADRGVHVRVAVDATNAAKDYNVGDDFLEERGIDIVRVKPSGSGNLMHLKVTVVDSDIVMTGSFNWNGTAALANDENMIVLRDPDVVNRYRDQVLEVRGDKPHATDGGVINAATTLHFAPEDKLDSKLVELIDAAEVSIDLAMFTFTRKTVADALVRAIEQRGVVVRAVLEAKRVGSSDTDEQLDDAGAMVLRAGNTIGEFSAMHQKYAVIDGTRVISGATNWTYRGTRKNDEDLLVIELPALVTAFQRNFADLLHVYGDIDDATVPHDNDAQMLVNAVHDSTEWGDRILVTGNHPALGNWDPHHGVELFTSTTLFPSWTARTQLPAGTWLEYKFVTIHPTGEVAWEPGPNRVLQAPPSGRAMVTSGTFGDTSDNWLPRD